MKNQPISKLLSIVLSIMMVAAVFAPITAAADSDVPSYTLSGTVDADYGVLPDSDELLEGYFQKQLYGNISFYGNTVGSRLNKTEKEIYNKLKNQLITVASGTNPSTEFCIALDQPFSWTVQELGVTEVTSGGKFTQEASDALLREIDLIFDFNLFLKSLLTDCPYELYWFDKTDDKALGLEYGLQVKSDEATLNSFTFYFTVANAYKGTSEYTVNTSKTSAASKAAEKAQDIVAEYADKTDLEKLDAYRTEICSLVSYNEAAANDGVSYGDPWQLIYVFDGDPDTNVVCEGYAKAFQYLCDLSEFTGDVVCNTVTGIMNGATGAGLHMWNVVEYGGKYYLVDITNCDTGTIGADTKLFMAGTDSTDGDRTYVFTIGSYQITYEYDEDQENLICDGYPVLSDSSLSSDKSNIYSGTCGENAKWSLDTATGVLTISGSGDMYDYSHTNKAPWCSQKDSIKSVYIENGITTIGNEAFYDCSSLTSITIPVSVISIGGRVFFNCISLESITIPDSVTNIGDIAFANCFNLKKVIMTDIAKWCNIDFKDPMASNPLCYAHSLYIGNTELTDIEIPNGVTEIKKNVFACCYSLTSITIPASVTQIGDSAFYECPNLTIKCYKNSYAYNYAVAKNIPYSLIIKDSIDPPSPPTLKSKTHNSVTLAATNGYEYKMDNGEWQDGNVFSGLNPNKKYTFYQRIKETNITYASESSLGLEVTTDKMSVATPEEPTVASKTTTTVTLTKVPAVNIVWTGKIGSRAMYLRDLMPIPNIHSTKEQQKPIQTMLRLRVWQ